MANKKHKNFLDFLIKSDSEEKTQAQVREDSAQNHFSDDDTLEKKEWLAEAGDEGQLTLDVYQTDEDIIIKSTIAGVKPEDLDVSFSNGMITIKGERRQEEKIDQENYFYQELYWGRFSRSVILPVEVDADKIEAELKNGILTIRLPKKEEKKQKKIAVKVS